MLLVPEEMGRVPLIVVSDESEDSEDEDPEYVLLSLEEIGIVPLMVVSDDCEADEVREYVSSVEDAGRVPLMVVSDDPDGAVVGYVRDEDSVMEPDGIVSVGSVAETVEFWPGELPDGVMVSVLVRVVCCVRVVVSSEALPDVTPWKLEVSE